MFLIETLKSYRRKCPRLQALSPPRRTDAQENGQNESETFRKQLAIISRAMQNILLGQIERDCHELRDSVKQSKIKFIRAN